MEMLCYIVDLDGCLASDRHRWLIAQPGTNCSVHLPMDSKEIDWETYFRYDLMVLDGVNENLAATLKEAFAQNYRIIYLTGRPERTRQATIDWLEANNLNFHDFLLMRKDWDYTPAREYKTQALEDFLDDGLYTAVIGFTDQPCDVEAYHAVGIPGLIVKAY